MKRLFVLACLCSTSTLAMESVNPDEPGFLQQKIDPLTEKLTEREAVLSTLRRIRISGYIQARYTHSEDSVSGVDASGEPTVTDGFDVRRGRLKTQYEGTVGKFLIQIDAAPSGVTLKDAEVWLTEPWSGKKYLTLIAGQTNWPFGYELLQSSSQRELPERTRVVNAFFAGSRDRGVKLGFKGGPVRAWVGVFDGNGIENKGFIGVDNDTEKDVYGRVAVDFGWFAAGVSGSGGLTYKPTDEAGPGRHYPRTRIGLDAQVYFHLFPFGETAVKGELIAGRTYHDDGIELFGQTGLGWYGLIVQNIGDHEQIAFRYDFFDPATGTPNTTTPSRLNQVHTFGLVGAHHFDEVLKLSVSYEIPLVFAGGPSATPTKENRFTVQLQAKF